MRFNDAFQRQLARFELQETLTRLKSEVRLAPDLTPAEHIALPLTITDKIFLKSLRISAL